jgi:putative oxidoreductase
MNSSQSGVGNDASAGKSSHAKLDNLAGLAGRVLLAVLFLFSGLGKLGAYSATAAYMSSAGVPAALLPVVIATELGGGLAVVLGWNTRIVALLLAGFSLVAAIAFHRNFADPMQMANFLKNVSIAGGFLLLVANGPGPISIDERVSK